GQKPLAIQPRCMPISVLTDEIIQTDHSADASHMARRPMSIVNPFAALREATKQVPALRYAYGVIGLVAGAAVATLIFRSPPAAIIAAIVMLVLMTLV